MRIFVHVGLATVKAMTSYLGDPKHVLYIRGSMMWGATIPTVAYRLYFLARVVLRSRNNRGPGRQEETPLSGSNGSALPLHINAG